MEIKYTKTLLTPELSKKLLEGNIDNRRVKQAVLLKYYKQIIEGRWVYGTAETIKIASTNRILDGQHRLESIRKYLNEYNEKHKIFDETTINTFDKDFINELLINTPILTNGTYTHISSGMGSTWFVRRNSNGKKQYLIMLTDDWGQYGKEFSRMPALKSFIHGYEKMIVL